MSTTARKARKRARRAASYPTATAFIHLAKTAPPGRTSRSGNEPQRGSPTTTPTGRPASSWPASSTPSAGTPRSPAATAADHHPPPGAHP